MEMESRGVSGSLKVGLGWASSNKSRNTVPAPLRKVMHVHPQNLNNGAASTPFHNASFVNLKLIQ